MKLVAALVAGLALLLPTIAAAGGEANPVPSWKCIKGVCLGQSRDYVHYRFSNDTPSGLSIEYGYRSPRVSNLSTEADIFLLPDGVRLGSKFPYLTGNRKWKGYSTWEGSGSVVFKYVRVRKMRVVVQLGVTKGRVSFLHLIRVSA